MRLIFVVVFSLLLLTGCPIEDSPNCQKAMVCEDQLESDCQKNECGETCNYYRTEWCWEECRNEEG